MFDSMELYVGQEIAMDVVLNNLAAMHYTSVKKSHSVGEFSQRGGILDIFPFKFEQPLRIDFDDDRIVSIYSVHPLTGKSVWKHKFVIVLPNRSHLSIPTPFTADIPLNQFIDMKRGDYVVHNQHGIGRYVGMEYIDRRDQKSEHLIIEYDGGDKLFVPKHDLRLVQKYVSFQKRPPRLYKLGSKEWKRIKTQIQKRLQRLAAELLHIQAARASLSGFAFSPNHDWMTQFEAGFGYDETTDQQKAIDDVCADMESDRPMDRLICGDVGYGKTEVALRAALKAVNDNKQVAVLVPTTILAEQHYYNFRQRFKDFPIQIDMLSRFRTKKEQVHIVKRLREGKVDIIIGTHRLFSKDIGFKDLGLIVIDEEQRFGVKAKEKLKQIRLLADVLTLTATPIPRTLHMALSGARDMSVISTPPHNRESVETHIVEFDENLIHKVIKRELKRKGQVFFLHNRVEDIEQVGLVIKRLFPKSQVDVAHGQMSPKVLEDIMVRFLEGLIDILVCTTIIESGIDIPNANTLIINRADRFGLSELHQLRGRVGRSDKKAYAYFMTPSWNILSTDAKSRINAIKKYKDLGSGFHIALEDLQIRGAGNLLGDEQSGYIASIGFDLYCRLLKESVEYLRDHPEELQKHQQRLQKLTEIETHQPEPPCR